MAGASGMLGAIWNLQGQRQKLPIWGNRSLLGAGSISAFPPLGRSCSPRGGAGTGVGVTLSSLLLLSVGGVSPGDASCPEHSQGLG